MCRKNQQLWLQPPMGWLEPPMGGSRHIWVAPDRFEFSGICHKMRKSRFPPSGSYQASCGSADSFYNGFWRFLILRIYEFLEKMPERCARVGFSPSGSYQASFGSALLFCQSFGRFLNRCTLRGFFGLSSPRYLLGWATMEGQVGGWGWGRGARQSCESTAKVHRRRWSTGNPRQNSTPKG